MVVVLQYLLRNYTFGVDGVWEGVRVSGSFGEWRVVLLRTRLGGLGTCVQIDDAKKETKCCFFASV